MTTSRVRFVLGLAIVVGVFWFLGAEIAGNWGAVRTELSQMNPVGVALSVLAFFGLQALLCAGWGLVLAGQGVRLAFRAVFCSYFVPNLGKYVPGKVAMVAGRIELVHRFGGSRSRAFAGFLLESALLVVVSIPFFFPLVDVALDYVDLSLVGALAAGAVVVGALWLLLWPAIRSSEWVSSRLPQMVLDWRYLCGSAFCYLGALVVYAISVILLVESLHDLPFSELALVGAAVVAAWTIGFVSFLTPGGLGVREAALVVFLQPVLSVTEATTLALIARVFWTVTELLPAILWPFFTPGGRLGGAADTDDRAA